MTPQEFCTWLKGFVAGSSKYNLTPEGWDLVREKLNEVVDDNLWKTISDPNTFKVQDLTPLPWAFPYPYPNYPYYTQPFVVGDPPPGQMPIVTCDAGANLISNNFGATEPVPTNVNITAQ